MTTAAIKKQLDTYIPLLTNDQQALVLEMVKNILHVENPSKRISQKQYNKELDEANERIAEGKFKTQEQALKALSKW